MKDLSENEQLPEIVSKVLQLRETSECRTQPRFLHRLERQVNQLETINDEIQQFSEENNC